MRSDERFRRPPVDLPDYFDRLESQLRAELLRNPPRRARHPGLLKMLRSMARPALHGSMAVVMAAVVVMAGRSAPSDLGMTATTLTAAEAGAERVWTTVVEIMDPQPKFTPLSVSRRPPRFVTLIPSRVQTPLPLPEVGIPATV